MNKKLFYINSVKMIGILCLIIGHCAPNTEIQRVIYSFHMPLFIFAHGYLNSYRHITSENIQQYIYRKSIKFFKIYILSSIFLILYGAVCVLFNVNCFYMRDMTHIRECILDTITFQGIGTLWFLPVVYFLDIVYLIKKKYFIILLYLISIVLYYYTKKYTNYLSNNSFKILIVIIRTFIMIPFYYFGVYMNNIMHSSSIKLYGIVIMISSFIIWCINVIIYKSEQIDVYTLHLPNLCIFYINAILASTFIFLICLYIFNNNCFFNRLVGGASYLYMLFNNLSLNTALSKIINIFYPYKSFFLDCISTFVVSSILALAFLNIKFFSSFFYLDKVLD